MRNNEFLNQIGQNIKAIRKQKGITIRTLGEMCGMDYSNLNHIENGYKDFHILSLKNEQKCKHKQVIVAKKE